MGTDKYPGENEYEAFIARSGGSDNAYTENEHTVYFFDIPKESLHAAVDMMAQFFSEPLLRCVVFSIWL